MLDEFSEEQKLYLQGLMSGLEVARTRGALPPRVGAHGETAGPSGPEKIHFEAQQRAIAAGRKLVPEEIAKRAQPLDMWDELRKHARDCTFPKGTDIFRFKFHGLFNVAPAQNAFMCRLRMPCGILTSHQFRAVADMAERWGGEYAHVTTRANLQIREIQPPHILDVLTAIQEAGLTSRGSGADNIRNITGNPTAGIDPQELYDVRPLCAEMHHYILNHRELYGLPRKFNIAFDSGGAISALEDTNDIGFAAVRVADGKGAPGIYFRMALGGITGHQDFARDTGVLLRAEECVPVAAAVVRVFIEHGERTDRTKARMKYVLDRMGLDEYMRQTEAFLGQPLKRLAHDMCEPRAPVAKHGHIGFHPQRQQGLNYVGVVLPVGKLTCRQMRGLASMADEYGSGTLRLTVWQNLLVSDIPDAAVDTVKTSLVALGLDWHATSVRAGLIACTGNKGCKFSASDTKTHAAAIADHLDACMLDESSTKRLRLDQPLNIHLTGCHHSCAQHYIGDIGLLAAKVELGEDEVEGYHVYIGGGYGAAQKMGREIYRGVAAGRVPHLIERMLRAYLERRVGPETFQQFTSRLETDALVKLIDEKQAIAA